MVPLGCAVVPEVGGTGGGEADGGGDGGGGGGGGGCSFDMGVVWHMAMGRSVPRLKAD